VHGVDDLRPASVPASDVTSLFGISDDGRFLTYGVSAVGMYGYTTVIRLDRAVSAHLNLFDNRNATLSFSGVLGDAPGVAVSRDGQVFAWVKIQTTPSLQAQVLLRRADQPAATVIGTTCLAPGGLYPSLCMTPAVSGDGRTVLYT